MYTVYVLIHILETHCPGKMSYLLSISSMDHSRTETSHFRFLDQLQAFLQIDIRIRLYYIIQTIILSSKNERIIGLRYKLKHKNRSFTLTYEVVLCDDCCYYAWNQGLPSWWRRCEEGRPAFPPSISAAQSPVSGWLFRVPFYHFPILSGIYSFLRTEVFSK